MKILKTIRALQQSKQSSATYKINFSSVHRDLEKQSVTIVTIVTIKNGYPLFLKRNYYIYININI